MPAKDSSKNGKRPLLRLQVLIVAITLTAVAVAILLGSQVYRDTREMATEQFNQQQLILAHSAAAGIESYYQELSEALSSLAQLPSIQQMTPECLQEMQHTYWGFPPRTSLRLLDSDGVLRLIYPFEGWRGELVGRDYSGETYFQEARETERISVFGLIINEQGETRVRVAVPLYLTHETETVIVGDESGAIVTPIDPSEPGAGEFQGVLAGSFDPHITAQDFISPIVSGETGYAWLLNEDGVFLAHHEEGFAGRDAFEVQAERNPDVSYAAIEQIQRRMMAGEEGVGRYTSGWHRGQRGEVEKLVAYTPVHIGDHIWSVAVSAPLSEVEEIVQTTKRTEQYTLAFVILALTAGGLSLLMTSYHWSRSLEREVAGRTRELRETITARKRAEESLRRSLEETARGQRLLLALSQAAQAVQRARTPDEVCRTVADEVARLGYQATIFTLTGDRAHLTVPHLTFGPAVLQAAEKLTGLLAQDYRFPLAPGGSFERILAAGETIYAERSTEGIAEALPGPVRPLADQLMTVLGLERNILAPLMVGGETHGLLAVSGADLTEADVPAVTAFATQAAIAIENARLFEDVCAGREQLRNLTSYLQTAREEDRAYIAREIHDEFGQSLTALKMDLAWLAKRLPADSPPLAEKTGAMSGLIDSTIQTVRRVATELRPGLLDDLGLAAAIEWQAQEWAERTGINCELYLGDEEIVLDRDLATAIFRVFQEALTNVARHAEATEVQVELEQGPDESVLVVRDNGKGIAPDQVSDPHSLGLIGMRERAHSWGGDVTFQSVPGQGTTITVRVPRMDAEEGRK